MKGIFGLLGLLLALLVTGFLVNKQLASTQQTPPIVPALQAPASAGSQSPGSAPATVGEQSRQVQQQYKQALEGALQQPRTAAEP